MYRHKFTLLWLSAMAALLSACTSSSETTFMRQNKAAAALAMMGIEAENRNSTRLDRIYTAETELAEACDQLRDAASHRMNGEETDIASDLLVMFDLDRCASTTDRVEKFIRIEAPEVARQYLEPRLSRLQ